METPTETKPGNKVRMASQGGSAREKDRKQRKNSVGKATKTPVAPRERHLSNVKEKLHIKTLTMEVASKIKPVRIYRAGHLQIDFKQPKRDQRRAKRREPKDQGEGPWWFSCVTSW